MSTPRPLRTPISASPQGGALLTSPANQGIEAIRQLVFLRMAGGGTTQHPWLQSEVKPELVFSDRRVLAQQLLARAREVFDGLERAEVARLLPETFSLDREAQGRWVVSFQWQPLRIGGVGSAAEPLRYVVE